MFIILTHNSHFINIYDVKYVILSFKTMVLKFTVGFLCVLTETFGKNFRLKGGLKKFLMYIPLNL